MRELLVRVAATLLVAAPVLLLQAPPAQAATWASTFNSRIRSDINHARHVRGHGTLYIASPLNAVAGPWSDWMEDHDGLRHNPNLARQITRQCPRWRYAAETVGEGPTDGGPVVSADRLFQAYMNSPEHRSILMSGTYHYDGIGTTVAQGLVWNVIDVVNRC